LKGDALPIQQTAFPVSASDAPFVDSTCSILHSDWVAKPKTLFFGKMTHSLIHLARSQ